MKLSAATMMIAERSEGWRTLFDYLPDEIILIILNFKSRTRSGEN